MAGILADNGRRTSTAASHSHLQPILQTGSRHKGQNQEKAPFMVDFSPYGCETTPRHPHPQNCPLPSGGFPAYISVGKEEPHADRDMPASTFDLAAVHSTTRTGPG